MAIPGRYSRSLIGGDFAVYSAGNVTTQSLKVVNTGICFRFTAIDSRDIKSVWLNWSTITSPGTITLRIETIDPTTGKPTGTLYDANAAITFTPTTGWQNVQFASLPTTGLTAGTEYGILIFCATTGTSMTLRAQSNVPAYPTVMLSAVDVSTRSNLAEVASSNPIATVVFEDNVEETLGFQPFATQTTTNFAFGTNGVGMKFTVPTGMVWNIGYIEWNCSRNGTPAGDLRCRIFSGSSVVSGSTITVDKDSLAGVTTRRSLLQYPTPLALSAGDYRVIFDSASSANSTNCFSFSTADARSGTTGLVPSSAIFTSTTDVTAGTITWVDDAARCPPITLRLDNIPDVSGGSAGILVHGGMTGGLRG